MAGRGDMRLVDGEDKKINTEVGELAPRVEGGNTPHR